MTECIHGINGDTCALCHPPAPARRGRPPLAPEWATTIKTWIPAIGRDWISGDELAVVSELTRGQVSAAIAHLRDNEPDFPLVSGPYGYRFSIDEEDIGRCRSSAFRTAHTRIRRSWSGVVKPYLEQGGLAEGEVRRITKSFERLLEDIEDLAR